MANIARIPEHFVPLEAIAVQWAKTFTVVATVVDVFETLAEWRRELRKERVYGQQSALMYNQAPGNRSVLRLFSGDNKEYYVLADLRKHPVRFKDMVAATLKAKTLLDEEVFVVLECKRFRTK